MLKALVHLTLTNLRVTGDWREQQLSQGQFKQKLVQAGYYSILTGTSFCTYRIELPALNDMYGGVRDGLVNQGVASCSIMESY